MENNLFGITINGENFKVALADTDKDRFKGLSGLPNLGKNKGMLFVFPNKIQMKMVMRDMNFDLDFLFLDEMWQVIDHGSLNKDDTKGIYPCKPCSMVIELPKDTCKRLSILKHAASISPDDDLRSLANAIKKFKNGGSFELVGEKTYKVKEDDIKAETGKLQILNTEGEVVANIEPGSRIFSRIHTEDLIKKFKNGDKLALADLMIQILDIQDNQKPDYVRK